MLIETRSSLMLQWTHILLSRIINKLFMSVQFNQIFCSSGARRFLLDL